MNYRDILRDMITRLLSGEWTVSVFEEEYKRVLLGEIPENAFSPAEEDFFGNVLERLDYAAKRVSKMARHDGWMTNGEFVEWTRNELEELNRLGEGYLKIPRERDS